MFDAILDDMTGTFSAVAPQVAAVRLIIAILLGGVIGWEREAHEKEAGLRTHMLISMAACLFILVALEIVHLPFAGSGELRVDPLRLIEAVTAGVAFLAAGVIFKSGDRVRNLTTGAGMWLTGQGLVPALMLACPAMMVGWLWLQRGRAFAAERVRAILFARLPDAGPVAVTLAASGYLGRVGASLLPMDQVSALVAAIGLPQWGWLTVLPLLIAGLSMLAVSPIMFAVFFGSLFGALPVLPTDATLLALSLSCGWALAMTTSPFATVVLLLARQNEVPAARLTMGWNAAFTAASVVLMAAFFFVMTGGA